MIDHLESGVLVPVDDPTTLARAMRNVLEDENLRQRIARQGHETYLAHFTEQSVVERYMEFFQRIIA